MAWWSWRILPPRPSVYLVSLSYRLRLFKNFGSRRLNNQNDVIQSPKKLSDRYGQEQSRIQKKYGVLLLLSGVTLGTVEAT